MTCRHVSERLRNAHGVLCGLGFVCRECRDEDSEAAAIAHLTFQCNVHSLIQGSLICAICQKEKLLLPHLED